MDQIAKISRDIIDGFTLVNATENQGIVLEEFNSLFIGLTLDHLEQYRIYNALFSIPECGEYRGDRNADAGTALTDCTADTSIFNV